MIFSRYFLVIFLAICDINMEKTISSIFESVVNICYNGHRTLKLRSPGFEITWQRIHVALFHQTQHICIFLMINDLMLLLVNDLMLLLVRWSWQLIAWFNPWKAYLCLIKITHINHHPLYRNWPRFTSNRVV